ncbi:MAG: hypothetical protein J0L78_13015 [Planctomycetes bacterium]|nr:hypothetical protein [Planctomycetota bacterium]
MKFQIAAKSTLVRTVATTAAITVGCSAQAQHLIDMAIGQSQGRIATGVFQLQGENVVPLLSQRVFISEFGTFPGFTNNPGWDSMVGAFQPASQIGFNIRKALRKWNGTAFPPGEAGIPAEQLQIKLGPAANTRLTPLADETVTGFSLAVNGAGEFHHHPGYTLLDPASDGLYLLELELWSTQPGLQASLPYWTVFSQNGSEDELRAAASWVRANVWQPTCPADLNNDGLVDDADFVAFVSSYNYLLCDPPGCPTDFNGDWVTDDADFSIFAVGYDALLCPE